MRDVLLLKNLDDVPQIFGPTLMMPGQSFRLPFAVASSYSFACTAHASGQLVVVVEARRATGDRTATIVPIGALTRYDRPAPTIEAYDQLLEAQ